MFAAFVAAGRIKAHLEVLDQQARDQRPGGQGLFHVVLGERHARLQQVLAAGAEQVDLAPVQAGQHDQPVEPVVLAAPAPYLLEGILELVAHAVEIDFGVVGRTHVEILDPDAMAVRNRQLIGALRDDAHAQVLEHRQNIGERHRVAVLEDLEAQQTGAPPPRLVEAHAQIVEIAQPGDIDHVIAGDVRRDVVGIGDRKGSTEAPGQFQPVLLAVLAHQYLGQLVFPGTDGLLDLVLDGLDVEIYRGVALGPDDEVDARQLGFTDLDGEIEPLALERALEDVLDLLAILGIEAVARNEHQAGKETAEALAPDEQPGLASLLQVENAHRHFQQLFTGSLEQFIARQGLEDVHQRLAGMAAGLKPRHLDHLVDLAPHQRGVLATADIGARREQPDQTLFAGDPAFVVEVQDRDVVHVATAMHAGGGIGLGDDDGIVGGGSVTAPTELAQRPNRCLAMLGVHDAQSAVGDRAQHAPVLTVFDDVLAVAQEREVIVGQPLEEVVRFLARFPGQGLVGFRQLASDLMGAIEHRPEIRHRPPHVAQGSEDALFDLGQHFGVVLPVDLQMHHRLGLPVFGLALAVFGQLHQMAALIADYPHDRVDDQVRRNAQLREGQHHRIDQEGHVVVDDLDDRVTRLPAVPVGMRVVDAEANFVAHPLAGEIQKAGGQGGQVLDRTVLELGNRHAPEETPDESGAQFATLTPRHDSGDLLQDLLFLLVVVTHPIASRC